MGFRNGVKRHFFPPGPQKATFNFPPENPDRYYDFKDTPVNWRPASPLIDRQKIPTEVESDIRTACATLYHNIENGVLPSPVSVPRKPSTRKPRKPPAAQAVSATALGNDMKRSLSIRTDSLSAPTGKANPLDQVAEVLDEEDVVIPQVRDEMLVASVDEAAAHESTSETMVNGGDLSTATASSTAKSTATRSSSNKTHVDRSLSDTARNSACSSEQAATSVNGDEVPAVPALETMASPIEIASPPTPKHLSDSGSEEDDIEAFLGENGSHIPCRTPSFSRPNDKLRSAQKKRLENPGFGPRKGSRRGVRGLVVVEEGSSHPIGLSEIGTGTHHPHEIDRLRLRNSGGEWPNTESEAAIVDTDGVLHVMTSEEEAQRQLDLQRAVMEKMRTGAIGGTADQTIPAVEVQKQVENHRLSSVNGLAPKNKPRVIHMSLCQEEGPCAGPGSRSSGGYQSGSALSPQQTMSATSSLSPTVVDADADVDATITPSGGGGLRPLQRSKSGLMRKLSVLALGRKKSVVSNTASSVTASG